MYTNPKDIPPELRHMIDSMMPDGVDVVWDRAVTTESGDDIFRHDGTDNHTPRRIDFTGGEFEFEVLSQIPSEKMLEFRILQHKLWDGDIPDNHLRMEDAISNMLREETTLPESGLILPRHTSTRYVLSDIMKKLDGAIGIPVPNWNFWAALREKNHDFMFFDGLTEDRLLDGFTKLAERGMLNSLLLVDPANPMGYRITQKMAKEIDEVALRYGIEILIDDVSRGTLPVGQRESIGTYFTRPYVVEGFSHRLGEGFFGNSSYVYVPDESMDIGFSQEKRPCICGPIFEYVYKNLTANISHMISERNTAFDSGLSDEIELIRPSNTSLISLVRFPDGIDSDEFLVHAKEVGITFAEIGWFYPGGFDVPPEARNIARIGVGYDNPVECFNAAQRLSIALNSYK